MKTTLEEIAEKALALPEQERALLADRLWQSLENDATSEVEPEVVALIQRRYEELKAGKVKGIPAEQFVAELRSELQCAKS
jgi:putative addiction module component (TIGR02574 family)